MYSFPGYTLSRLIFQACVVVVLIVFHGCGRSLAPTRTRRDAVLSPELQAGTGFSSAFGNGLKVDAIRNAPMPMPQEPI